MSGHNNKASIGTTLNTLPNFDFKRFFLDKQIQFVGAITVIGGFYGHITGIFHGEPLLINIYRSSRNSFLFFSSLLGTKQLFFGDKDSWYAWALSGLPPGIIHHLLHSNYSTWSASLALGVMFGTTCRTIKNYYNNTYYYSKQRQYTIEQLAMQLRKVDASYFPTELKGEQYLPIDPIENDLLDDAKDIVTRYYGDRKTKRNIPLPTWFPVQIETEIPESEKQSIDRSILTKMGINPDTLHQGKSTVNYNNMKTSNATTNNIPVKINDNNTNHPNITTNSNDQAKNSPDQNPHPHLTENPKHPSTGQNANRSSELPSKNNNLVHQPSNTQPSQIVNTPNKVSSASNVSRAAPSNAPISHTSDVNNIVSGSSTSTN